MLGERPDPGSKSSQPPITFSRTPASRSRSRPRKAAVLLWIRRALNLNHALISERLRALIIQNANVYEEGLGPKWGGIAQYWADPKAHPEVLDVFVSLAATEERHTLGTAHPERYNPDTWTDEYAHLSRPGQREIQAALLYDYRTNVASYQAWQARLRKHKPPILVVRGRNDPSSIPTGAEAFERDLPDAEIHLLDAGHVALDEENDGSRVSFLRSWTNSPSD
jgi:pimeloyl-ACP methyl ester carboxylesterase